MIMQIAAVFVPTPFVPRSPLATNPDAQTLARKMDWLQGFLIGVLIIAACLLCLWLFLKIILGDRPQRAYMSTRGIAMMKKFHDKVGDAMINAKGKVEVDENLTAFYDAINDVANKAVTTFPKSKGDGLASAVLAVVDEVKAKIDETPDGSTVDLRPFTDRLKSLNEDKPKANVKIDHDENTADSGNASRDAEGITQDGK